MRFLIKTFDGPHHSLPAGRVASHKRLIMKKQLLWSFMFFMLAAPAFAQEDVEGCKDHPSFNRMPGFYITDCEKNFDMTEVWMSGTESKNIEGNKTKIVYQFNTDNGGQAPSFYQVVKNFENAIAKYNGKRIYMGSQDATLFCRNGNKDVWILLDAPGSTAETYTLQVIEVEAMKQDIAASDMLDALNKDGHIALYINFETGKSDIKSESQKIIGQIVEMMKGNPALKVSIEGHTDNVGTAANNKTLSENRAKAVVEALVAKGIERSRLSSKGWGQDKPVADNKTEEGRAQNRRVEIVKQ
ncbi:MAG: OmpA family protein [Chitinophagales bacterium]